MTKPIKDDWKLTADGVNSHIWPWAGVNDGISANIKKSGI